MVLKAVYLGFKKMEVRTSPTILALMLSVYFDFHMLISDLRVLFLKIRK